MSLKYDPNTPWAIPVLAQFVQIREYYGYHLIYKNGFIRGKDYEHDMLAGNIGEFCNGWTVRLFMFRPDMTSDGAEVHVIYRNKYWCKAKINKNDPAIYNDQKGYDGKKDNVIVPTVNAGDVFSFGIRWYDHQYFVPVANEAGGDWTNFTSYSRRECRFKIWQRDYPLLSLHLTDEHQNRNYSLPYEWFDMPGFDKPPGSSFIATLKLKNTSSDIKLGIYQESDAKYIDYGKRTDLAVGSTFYAYIRNLPDHYTMATSFDPAPRTVLHGQKWKRFIFFYRDVSVCDALSLTHYILYDK